MSRSISQTQAENHRRAALSLEPLEPRVLLSGDGLSAAVSSLAISPAWFGTVPGAYQPGSLLERYGTAELSWDGQTVEAVRGHWIVQFSDEALQGIDSVAETAGLLAGGLPFQVVQGLGMAGQVLIRTFGASGAAVQSWLSANPYISYFEPDRIVEIQAIPNDPYFGQLWGLRNVGQYLGIPDADIDATLAWDLETGSSSIIVAVVDSGVDYTHPDLAGNMWINALEFAGTGGVDDDLNGFVDDIYGWDFANGDADPMDDNGHGTHVAGTIGAVGNNSVGVAGVNWDVSIMAVKFLDAGGSGTTSAAIQALNYLRTMRAEYNDGSGDGVPGANVRVANHSWGGYGFDAGLYTAFADNGAAGILSAVAAGNESNDNESPLALYPATFDLDTIISVAATDSRDQLAGFSNYGATTVDLGAPGVSILSTLPPALGYSYGIYLGTSMATPHVAGVAALAWAYNPSATLTQVRDAIFSGVDPLPSLTGITLTGGRLNARATLERVLYPDPFFIPVETIISGPVTVTVYDSHGVLDISGGDVQVNFASGGAVSSVKVGGTGGGTGLIIDGASSIGSIKDSRKGTEPLGVVAADTSIKSVETKHGFTGANLNGRTVGGITFAGDIDGDGMTTDLNMLYTTGGVLSVKTRGTNSGDVWVGGTAPSGLSIKSFKVEKGPLGGDLYAAGFVGSVDLGGDYRYEGVFDGTLSKMRIRGDLFGVLQPSVAGQIVLDGDMVMGRLAADTLGEFHIYGSMLPLVPLIDPTLAFESVVTAGAAGNITINGDMLLSYVLAGADLGDDWFLGGIGTAADTYLPGSIQVFKVRGNMVDSMVAAGIVPVSGMWWLADPFDAAFLWGGYIGRAEVWGTLSADTPGLFSGIGAFELRSAGITRGPDPVNQARYAFVFDKLYPLCYFVI